MLTSIAQLGGTACADQSLYALVASNAKDSILDISYDFVHARPKWIYELQWVRHDLVKAGQIDGSKRGIWRLTQTGLNRVLAESPALPNLSISNHSLLDDQELIKLIEDCVQHFYTWRIKLLSELKLADLLGVLDPCDELISYSESKPRIVSRLMLKFFDLIEGYSSTSIIFAPLIIALMKNASQLTQPTNIKSSQAFWEELTDDPNFYLKLILCIREVPEKHRANYNLAWDKAVNRFERDFLTDFSLSDGSIDWEKLVEFNSGKTKK